MKKGKMVKAQPMPDLNTEFSMETLGSAIRSKRTDRGWRIDDLASKANLSRRTVMKVEKGDTSVTFANVLVLMDILELWNGQLNSELCSTIRAPKWLP